MNIEEIKLTRNAIKNSDLEKIREIFSSDPNFLNQQTAFGTWLQDASTLGKLDVVKLLIELGINVNLESPNIEGNSLVQAILFGHNDIAKLLLQNEIKIDVSEPTKNPLFSAIYAGNIEGVKILIDSGIDLKIKYTGKRMKGMDALANAEERGETEIAKLIKAALDKK
jgi:uncharacterized protein